MTEEQREKEREYQRRYREKNPEKVREYSRRYLAENPEKHRERCRRYRAKNPEKDRERSRRRYAENREAAIEYQRRYREENPEREREKRRRYRAKNPEKELERNRRNYEKNWESRKEYGRRYRAKNQETIRELRRRYYVENRENVIDKSRRYRAENPERERERNRRRYTERMAEKLRARQAVWQWQRQFDALKLGEYLFKVKPLRGCEVDAKQQRATVRRFAVKYGSMTAAQRLAAVPGVFKRGADAVTEVAVLVKALADDGRDLEGMGLSADSVFGYLQIADCKLSSDAFVHIGFRRGFVERLARVPLEEQGRIFKRGKIRVCTLQAGEVTPRDRALAELADADVELVIADDGHVRGEEEQAEILRVKEAARRRVERHPATKQQVEELTRERDALKAEAGSLREENKHLKKRVRDLERRIRDLERLAGEAA